MKQLSKRLLPIHLLLIGVIASCEDSEDSIPSATTSSGNEETDAGESSTPIGEGTGGDVEDASGDEGGNETGSTPTEDALYVVVTQIFSAGSATSYAIVTDSLDAEANLDTSNALELPNRVLGLGIPHSGQVFFAGRAAPTIDRYDVTDEGALIANGSVSFVNQAVESIGEYQGQLPFFDEDSAYYFDSATGQIIAWNPSDMTVIGAITPTEMPIESPFPDPISDPAPAPPSAANRLTFSSSPIIVDSMIYLAAAWRNDDANAVGTRSAMVALDTTTHTASVVSTDLCGYARESVLGDDGMIYVATEAFGAATYRINPDFSSSPCLLRFDPSTQTFDETPVVDLLAAAGNATAVGSIFSAGSDAAFVRVLDESLIDVTSDTPARVLASAPAWQWWRLPLTNNAMATQDTALPASGGSSFIFDLDIGPVAVELDSTNGVTQLRSLNGGEALATVPGLVFSIVQVQ